MSDKISFAQKNTNDIYSEILDSYLNKNITKNPKEYLDIEMERFGDIIIVLKEDNNYMSEINGYKINYKTEQELRNHFKKNKKERFITEIKFENIVGDTCYFFIGKYRLKYVWGRFVSTFEGSKEINFKFDCGTNSWSQIIN